LTVALPPSYPPEVQDPHDPGQDQDRREQKVGDAGGIKRKQAMGPEQPIDPQGDSLVQELIAD
jgi:hypothetical protein